MLNLRPYQQRTVDQVRRLAKSGSRKILTVMPTGAGKTHTMADLALGAISKGHKVLCLMHRRGLVEQMVDRFTECGIEAGYLMAGKEYNLAAQCQVASLWTYSRRLKLAEKEYNQYWVNAPVVLIDEAHHVLNKTYETVLCHYHNAFVVGCTATPTLSTGAGLGNYFDSMVNVVTMDELLSGGYLVPGEYYGPSEPDLSKLKTVLGDYEKKGLDAKLNKPQIIGDVVDNWMGSARDKSTMVFAITRKHAKALCHEFNNRGVTAEYLDAYSKDDQRDDVLRRFRSGDTRIICQVALYTEGTDIPEIECLVDARPTKSLGLHRQILGRGARPHPGKESFMVLDHGGNIRRLGYYEDEMAWTLEGKKNSNKPKQQRKKEKHILTCEYCSGLISGSRCKICGNEIKDYGKKIAALDAELVKLSKSKAEKIYTAEEKRQWYAMFEYEQRRLNKSHKWLLAQYRSKFDVWPRGMDNIAPMEPSRECKSWLTYQRIRWVKSKKRHSLFPEAVA